MDLFNKPSGTELLNSAVSATWGRLTVATEENECAIIIQFWLSNQALIFQNVTTKS